MQYLIAKTKNLSCHDLPTAYSKPTPHISLITGFVILGGFVESASQCDQATGLF